MGLQVKGTVIERLLPLQPAGATRVNLVTASTASTPATPWEDATMSLVPISSEVTLQLSGWVRQPSGRAVAEGILLMTHC